MNKRDEAAKLYCACPDPLCKCSEDEQEIFKAGWDAAWAERGRVDAEIAKKHSLNYFSQMEGAGQPDFQICEFAMIACQYVEVDIRALYEKGEK